MPDCETFCQLCNNTVGKISLSKSDVDDLEKAESNIQPHPPNDVTKHHLHTRVGEKSRHISYSVVLPSGKKIEATCHGSSVVIWGLRTSDYYRRQLINDGG